MNATHFVRNFKLSLEVTKCSLVSIAVIFNVIVITAITTSKSLRHVKANQLTAHVSLCHVLLGIFSIVDYYVNTTLTQWFLYAFNVGLDNALITLSVDRCVAITFPYKYRKFSDSHLYFLVVLGWLIAIGVFVMSLLSGEKSIQTSTRHGQIMIIAKILIIMILCSTNVLVFLIFVRQIKAINKVAVLSQNTDGEVRNRNDQVKLEFAHFNVCFGAVISYTALWLPFVILRIVEFTRDIEKNEVLFEWLVNVASINWIVDPIIFFTCKRDMRRRILLAFRKKDSSVGAFIR